MADKRQGIDIIIPVYNGFEDLVSCVDSLRRHTDLSLDRVILINDCSSDPRVHPYLQEQADHGMIYLNNEENLGFSNNVNKGMLQSPHRDVILLNSDTLVTRGWVDKIVTCAYSRDEIATVTPLSNNATLCSVPVMCGENVLPDGLSVDEMGDLVEACSVRRYPRITVAVGFCMFIKRAVIDEVGLFDAATFEKGYGEENDFCNRAEQLGYIHVMCDDTFIYHVGSVSFLSEEKKKLIASHAAILDDWYPTQMRNNHLYCINNPDQDLRGMVHAHMDLHNGKPSLLYLLHLDFREDSYGHIGGTQFHVRDLTQGLLHRYNILVLGRDDDHLRFTVYTEKGRHSFRFPIGKPDPYFRYRNAELDRIFSAVLDEFRVETVHIHHIQNLSLDLFYAAHRRGIPLVATLHDYSMLCPAETLLDYEDRFCGGAYDRQRCTECLRQRREVAPQVEYRLKWQTEFRKVLALCDRIIFPSQDTFRRITSFYPELTARSSVIEHGCTIRQKESAEVTVIPAEALEDTRSVVYAVDMLNISSQSYLDGAGWLAVLEQDNRFVELYLAAPGEDETVILTRISKHSRPDVADNLGVPLYSQSGFRFRHPLALKSDAKDLFFAVRVDGRYFRATGTLKDMCLIGLEESENSPPATAKPRHRIAFLGGMVSGKGSKLAVELFRSAPKEEYDWFVFGIIGDAELDALEQDNLHKMGAYDPSALPELMRRFSIDLTCILSICPETFCYTLSESVSCGVPVLCLDLGAQGERVCRDGYGWVVPAQASSAAVLDTLNRIFTEKDEYDRVKELTVNFRGKTAEEMCEEYHQLYQSLPRREAHYLPSDPGILLAGYQREDKTAESDRRILKLTETVEALRRELVLGDQRLAEKDRLIAAREGELNAIKQTRSYRLVQKLNRLLGRIK